MFMKVFRKGSTALVYFCTGLRIRLKKTELIQQPALKQVSMHPGPFLRIFLGGGGGHFLKIDLSVR